MSEPSTSALFQPAGLPRTMPKTMPEHAEPGQQHADDVGAHLLAEAFGSTARTSGTR